MPCCRKETQCTEDKRGHAVFLLSRFNECEYEKTGACGLREIEIIGRHRIILMICSQWCMHSKKGNISSKLQASVLEKFLKVESM